MPSKKDGMLFEVHPTPIKGKDGKNLVYVRPAMSHKITMNGLEDFCNRNYHSPYGEIYCNLTKNRATRATKIA